MTTRRREQRLLDLLSRAYDLSDGMGTDTLVRREEEREKLMKWRKDALEELNKGA